MKNAYIGAVFFALLLALSACGGSAPSSRDQPGPLSSSGDDLSNPLGRWAWGDQRPQAGTLIEARRIDEARRLFDDGLYDQAHASLAALFTDGSAHPLAYHLQAQLHAQRGDFSQATAWCDKAIAASPWWVEPRILLAQCFIKDKRLASAETVFADIDRLAPLSPWGPFGQGAVALMRGDRDRAVSLIDAALGRDANHLPSLKARIELAGWLKQDDLEDRLLSRYLQQDPDAAWAHARLGALALATNRFEDARRAYVRAYALSPDRSLAQCLAEIAQRRGNDADAVLWQERAGIKTPPTAP